MGKACNKKEWQGVKVRTLSDVLVCYIDSMKSRKEYGAARGQKPGGPAAFRSIGAEGARRGLYPFTPPPSMGMVGGWNAGQQAREIGGHPPARVLPGGKTNAGQSEPGIFAHKTKKFLACYVTHSKNAAGIYPPFRGG